MRCIDCEDMACKIFTHKTEIWTGYCMNKSSPKYHTVVMGDDSCTIAKELDLF